MVEQIRDLYLKREWLDCIALCNELHDLVDRDFFSLYFRALCKAELNLIDESLTDFKLSRINLKKNRFPSFMKECNQDIDFGIVQVFRKQRKYEEALAQLGEILLVNPKYSKGHILKGNIYVDMDDNSKAIDAVNDGLKVIPRDEELLKFKNYLVYRLTTDKKD